MKASLKPFLYAGLIVVASVVGAASCWHATLVDEQRRIHDVEREREAGNALLLRRFDAWRGGATPEP